MSYTISRRRLVILGAVMVLALAGCFVLLVSRGTRAPATVYAAKCEALEAEWDRNIHTSPTPATIDGLMQERRGITATLRGFGCPGWEGQ